MRLCALYDRSGQILAAVRLVPASQLPGRMPVAQGGCQSEGAAPHWREEAPEQDGEIAARWPLSTWNRADYFLLKASVDINCYAWPAIWPVWSVIAIIGLIVHPTFGIMTPAFHVIADGAMTRPPIP
jgi:hypothetical protein